jgi:Rps23 Pro-64 3,4-dihydroxylase Tpa1-like proline 4-hydroxylase
MNQMSPMRPAPAADGGPGGGFAAGFDAAVARMAPAARLLAEKDALRARYRAAVPFPHLVLDGFFDPDVLDRVAAEFPGRGGRDWLSYDTANEVKQTSRGAADLPAFSQAFLWRMCAPPMLRALREVTGQDDLCADPLFHGGGLHESLRGGWLNLHADWTRHPVLPLTRRLNLIVYLNRGWDPAWGGALELRNPGGGGPVAKVEPLFNRAVLFPTTAETLHGFPDPIRCPADRSRRSVSLFYWSPDPEAIKAGAPIAFLPGTRQTRMRAFARSLVPPAAFAARDRLKALLRGKGATAPG